MTTICSAALGYGVVPGLRERRAPALVRRTARVGFAGPRRAERDRTSCGSTRRSCATPEGPRAQSASAGAHDVVRHRYWLRGGRRPIEAPCAARASFAARAPVNPSATTARAAIGDVGRRRGPSPGAAPPTSSTTSPADHARGLGQLQPSVPRSQLLVHLRQLARDDGGPMRRRAPRPRGLFRKSVEVVGTDVEDERVRRALQTLRASPDCASRRAGGKPHEAEAVRRQPGRAQSAAIAAHGPGTGTTGRPASATARMSG
jgi:hypothetical protein